MYWRTCLLSRFPARTAVVLTPYLPEATTPLLPFCLTSSYSHYRLFNPCWYLPGLVEGCPQGHIYSRTGSDLNFLFRLRNPWKPDHLLHWISSKPLLIVLFTECFSTSQKSYYTNGGGESHHLLQKAFLKPTSTENLCSWRLILLIWPLSGPPGSSLGSAGQYFSFIYFFSIFLFLHFSF